MSYKASIGILTFCNPSRLSASLSDAVHYDLGLNRCILVSYILAVLVAVPLSPFSIGSLFSRSVPFLFSSLAIVFFHRNRNASGISSV